MAEIGYKIPYNNTPTDIGEIAAPGYSNTLAPCVSFGKAGFRTGNKTGPNDNKFLAVDNCDPWKTGIGVRNVKIKIEDTEQTIHYYSSSVKYHELTNDIASIYSCPNFKKVIGFYGDGTQPDPSAIKVFERKKTYRLKISRWNNGFLISIGDDATDGSGANVGNWHIKSNTGKIPTSLIVGIQAAGGDGAFSASSGSDAGGGSGACGYFVLDWEKARQKVHNQGIDYVLFDFYITPIKGWASIVYPNNPPAAWTLKNNCVAINLKDSFYGSSNDEEIKSKCIVGCGQAANGTRAGVAGIVKNYDLGDTTFGIETGKTYTNDELSEYGIHILTMHKSGNVTNAGNGGGVSSAGYDSNKYWLTTTNKPIDGDYFNYSDDVHQFEHLYKHTGGSTVNSSGGGGASSYANGGDGGRDGTLGSGGGGWYKGLMAGGKGGLPYIFFCSNMDFSITTL